MKLLQPLLLLCIATLSGCAQLQQLAGYSKELNVNAFNTAEYLYCEKVEMGVLVDQLNTKEAIEAYKKTCALYYKKGANLDFITSDR